MLEELKFVQGAVAKKDFLPAMTHFVIKDGTIRSFNGTIALSSPIPLAIDCKPKGTAFYKAIQNCTDTVAMTLTASKRLSIKSGKFRALVECIDEETVHPLPEGKIVQINGEALLKGFKTCYPFIGDDASKKWTNGLLLKSGSMYATCNVVLVEYWHGADLPVAINIPSQAIKEIVRVGEVPMHLQLDEKSCTFHYESGKWIRTQLLESDWPDVTRILDKPFDASLIPDEFFKGIDTIKAFVDALGQIFITNGRVHTHLSDEGASYDVPDLSPTIEGVYNVEMIKLLEGVAKSIDLTTYPDPCGFFGDNLRGVIVGMKKLGAK